MIHAITNIIVIERDILSGRVGFEEGFGCVPSEEKKRFLRRLNNSISLEWSKSPSTERKAELKKLDELVSTAIVRYEA